MTTLDRLAATYSSVLENQLGLDTARPQADLISFRALGLTFLVVLHADDPELLTLRCPFSATAEFDHADLIDICHAVTRQMRGAHVTTDDDGRWAASVEMLVAGTDQLPQADHLAAVLPRALRIVSTAARTTLLRIHFQQIVADR